MTYKIAKLLHFAFISSFVLLVLLCLVGTVLPLILGFYQHGLAYLLTIGAYAAAFIALFLITIAIIALFEWSEKIIEDRRTEQWLSDIEKTRQDNSID